MNTFDYIVQMFGLQFYHHATGQYSVIFATLIKFYAIFSNSAAMSTTSTSDPYLSGKNSYAYTNIKQYVVHKKFIKSAFFREGLHGVSFNIY